MLSTSVSSTIHSHLQKSFSLGFCRLTRRLAGFLFFFFLSACAFLSGENQFVFLSLFLFLQLCIATTRKDLCEHEQPSCELQMQALHNALQKNGAAAANLQF